MQATRRFRGWADCRYVPGVERDGDALAARRLGGWVDGVSATCEMTSQNSQEGQRQPTSGEAGAQPQLLSMLKPSGADRVRMLRRLGWRRTSLRGVAGFP